MTYPETLKVCGPHGCTKNNLASIYPVEYKVLVRKDTVEEKTSGGIILPQDQQKREQSKQQSAVLIAVGGLAFNKWPDAPVIGEKLYVNQYAGAAVVGADGEEYTLINDQDITAVIKGADSE